MPSASAFDPPEDRFTPIGELGRGGMGRVDEAFDRALGRPVAVKHMLSSSEVDLARFEREARITARLEHPGIVPIHDVGRTADGTPFYVMRRVDGQPLDDLVQGKTFEDRLALVPNVLAACDACAFAHARNVIHRDIKPTNILIGPFGETLVIDWGLARTIGEAAETDQVPVSEPNLTRAGVVAGTPGFMAPEQARGEDVDARADVFALGATLFYVVSGELPYAASSATEMIALAGANRSPDWRRLPEATPPDLRAIVVKAMAPERAERYRDAGELAADLRRFVSGKLVGAYHYGRLEQLRRWIRRHKATVGVAVVAMLVIAIGSVLSVRRILTERDDANRARALAEAQRLEARRTSDRMLVQRALSISETDPVAAVLALRTLPVDSTEWDRAAVAAASAESHGIPFGFSIETNIGPFEVSPDSRRVAIKGVQEDMISLVDLVDRKRSPLVLAPGALALKWLDPTTLAVLLDDELRLVDITTRATRSIPLPGRGNVIDADRAGQLALWTTDGDVFELSADRSRFEPAFAHDVKSLARVGAHRWVMLQHGKITLREDDGRLVPLVGRDPAVEPTMITSNGDRVAAILGSQACVWNVAAAPVLTMCTIVGRRVLFGVVGDSLFFVGDGLTRTTATGTYIVHSGNISLSAPIPGGIVYASDEGGLVIYDASGVYQTGPRTLRYRRAMITPDRKFLVTLTSTSELLVWDLARNRPQLMTLPLDEQLISAGRRYVWTMQLGFGVSRYDRTTGEHTVENVGMGVLDAYVESTEHWLIARQAASGALLVHELGTDRTRLLPQDSLIHARGGLLYEVDGAGVVSRIENHTPTQIGTFAGASAEFTVGARHAVARLRDGRLCRMLLAGGAVECTHTDAVFDDMGVTDDGSVIGLQRGALWRWDGTTAGVIADAPQQLQGLLWSGARLIAYSHNAVTTFDHGTVSSRPIPTLQRFGIGDDQQLFGISPNGIPTVLDLGTSLTYQLPMMTVLDGEPFTSMGSTIAATYSGNEVELRKHRVAIYEVHVPRDPVALRRWLADVTNASADPGTDVVTWP